MPKSVNKVPFTPKLERKKRVAAYARVSSGKDAMLHSLSSQVAYYSELIQQHSDWEYIGVYADEAMTGTKDSRDEFHQLLMDCRDGRIDMVLTKSISRFTRNTVTLLESVRELKMMGVDVFFEEQNIHTMSAEGELMLTILASYAQEESLSASENQKWRIRAGFENGELLNWRFLFGYRMAEGGAVGQNIAGVMNNMMSGANVQPTPGAVPPPIPSTTYYVAVNGQATGPFDNAKLTQMPAAGQLAPDSLVWKNGMAQWAMASTADELRYLLKNNIPPIPPQE